MRNLLVVNSSALADHSASRELVAEAVTRLMARWPSAAVVHRDLGSAPVPHLAIDNLAGIRGTAESASEHAARHLSETLLAELKAADTILIGAPMYNFGLPTGLRAWFDYLLRPGETFSYSESGPVGLIHGKKVYAILSSGGIYSEGAAQTVDFQGPYLRHLLGFMGIGDVTLIRAEGIAYGPEARDAAIDAARRSLDLLLDRALAPA